jgi:hypothetical protein
MNRINPAFLAAAFADWKPSCAARMLDIYLGVGSVARRQIAAKLDIPAPDSTVERKA